MLRNWRFDLMQLGKSDLLKGRCGQNATGVVMGMGQIT